MLHPFVCSVTDRKYDVMKCCLVRALLQTFLGNVLTLKYPIYGIIPVEIGAIKKVKEKVVSSMYLQWSNYK